MDVQSGGHISGQVLALRGDPRPATTGREGLLASVASGPLSGRFCAWRGFSDSRYVTSIYAVDRAADDSGLPDFEAFVVIAVARSGLGRRIVGVAAIERPSERRAALALGLSQGADEWHVHFLAEDRMARAAMVADLRARHLSEVTEARCA